MAINGKWMFLHAMFSECSDPKAEWIVQDLRNTVSLPQPSLADLPAWQTEAYRPLQWADSRKAAVQPRRAHGELTSHISAAVWLPISSDEHGWRV